MSINAKAITHFTLSALACCLKLLLMFYLPKNKKAVCSRELLPKPRLPFSFNSVGLWCLLITLNKQNELSAVYFLKVTTAKTFPNKSAVMALGAVIVFRTATANPSYKTKFYN